MSNFRPEDAAPSTVPANIASTVRAALVGIAGWMVGKGWLTDDLAQAAIPLVLAILPLAWSFVKNSNTKKTIQSAIEAPAGLAK